MNTLLPPPPPPPTTTQTQRGMAACSGLDFAKDTEGLGSFTYAMGHGNIPIYAHDLKNTEVGPSVRLCGRALV